MSDPNYDDCHLQIIKHKDGYIFYIFVKYAGIAHTFSGDDKSLDAIFDIARLFRWLVVNG